MFKKNASARHKSRVPKRTVAHVPDSVPHCRRPRAARRRRPRRFRRRAAQGGCRHLLGGARVVARAQVAPRGPFQRRARSRAREPPRARGGPGRASAAARGRLRRHRPGPLRRRGARAARAPRRLRPRPLWGRAAPRAVGGRRPLLAGDVAGPRRALFPVALRPVLAARAARRRRAPARAPLRHADRLALRRHGAARDAAHRRAGGARVRVPVRPRVGDTGRVPAVRRHYCCARGNACGVHPARDGRLLSAPTKVRRWAQQRSLASQARARSRSARAHSSSAAARATATSGSSIVVVLTVHAFFLWASLRCCCCEHLSFTRR